MVQVGYFVILGDDPIISHTLPERICSRTAQVQTAQVLFVRSACKPRIPQTLSRIGSGAHHRQPRINLLVLHIYSYCVQKPLVYPRLSSFSSQLKIQEPQFSVLYSSDALVPPTVVHVMPASHIYSYIQLLYVHPPHIGYIVLSPFDHAASNRDLALELPHKLYIIVIVCSDDPSDHYCWYIIIVIHNQLSALQNHASLHIGSVEQKLSFLSSWRLHSWGTAETSGIKACAL